MHTSPTNILFLVPPAEGGMAEHVLLLMRGLDPQRFRVSLACSKGSLYDRAKELGFRVHVLPISLQPNPLALVTSVARLAALLGREKPDILHAHSWSAGLLASFVQRLPIHHAAFLCTLHSFPPDSALSARVISAVGAGADSIVCVSRAISSVLSEDARKKVHIIPNGIDIPDIYPSQHEARETLSLPQDTPIIGAVARLAPQKGIAVLVDAAARVPDVHFAVIGDGPLRPELESRIRQLDIQNRFHLLGKREGAKMLLPAFDIIAIPSLSEGSSIIGMEAMAAGRPIVASLLPAFEDIVLEDQTGIYVPPENPEALADALSALLHSPEKMQQMGTTGRLRVQEHFTSAHMVTQTAKLYEDIILSERG